MAAKIASNMRKPNGQTLLLPSDVLATVAPCRFTDGYVQNNRITLKQHLGVQVFKRRELSISIKFAPLSASNASRDSSAHVH